MNEFLEKAEQFGIRSFELIKLKLIDRAINLISKLTFIVLVSVFLIVFYVMLNIGVALWLGIVYHLTYEGFLYLSLFNLVLAGFILIVLKNFLISRLKIYFLSLFND